MNNERNINNGSYKKHNQLRRIGIRINIGVRAEETIELVWASAEYERGEIDKIDIEHEMMRKSEKGKIKDSIWNNHITKLLEGQKPKICRNKEVGMK